MKYDWDINELRKRKRILNKLKKEITLDELLNEELNNINEMINYMKNSHYKIKTYNDINLDGYFDNNSMVTNINYYSYKEILPYIKNNFSKLYRIFSAYSDNHKNYSLTHMKNIKELVSTSYEVYNSLPTNDTKYLDLFLKYTDPHNSNLKLTNIDINSNDMIYGYTYFFKNPTYTPYIILNLENNLTDLEILCHEISHAIFFDPSVTTYDRNYYLQEVEGFYFEYLVRKYLSKKKYNKKEIDELEYQEFYTIYDGYISYYIMNIFMDKFSKNKDITKEEIVNYILDKTKSSFNVENINESYIRCSLNMNSYFYIKYLVSYLTFLDIEKVDKKDPEKAFNLLVDVCNIKEENIYHKLRKLGITFMDDNFSNLKDKIKLLNKI